jgi:riboflavin kinase / FMN adenylyltransferase
MTHTLTGIIVHGQANGKKLGFPTVNLNTSDALPDHGVYAGWCEIEGAKYMAAIHIGPVPVFGQIEVCVEAHLLDFDQDVYGKVATLTCTEFLRGISNFESTAALSEQLKKDVEQTRELLSGAHTQD